MRGSGLRSLPGGLRVEMPHAEGWLVRARARVRVGHGALVRL